MYVFHNTWNHKKKTTLVAKSFKKKSFSSSQKRLLEEFLSLTLFCNDLLKLCVFLQGVPTHWWQGVRLQIFREFWGFLVDGLGIQAKTLGKNVYIHPESSCECFSYFFPAWVWRNPFRKFGQAFDQKDPGNWFEFLRGCVASRFLRFRKKKTPIGILLLVYYNP